MIFFDFYLSSSFFQFNISAQNININEISLCFRLIESREFDVDLFF